jgi:predicted membrane-bound mannosyltransferase
MRSRANDRVGAHQVAYVFDAVLAHLFGLAERPAHTDDCSVMLFDPRFPGRDPFLHLCVSRLL